MSIMELGALGEFIGSILVLGTLVYLSMQVRQGNAHSRFTTTHAIAGAGHAAWLAVAQSPELAAVMAKLETGEPLDIKQWAESNFQPFPMIACSPKNLKHLSSVLKMYPVDEP